MKLRTAALCLLTLAACGGKKGTLTLEIVVSPIDDPFVSASEARFTVGPKTQSVPVVNGHFDFELEQEPPEGDPAPIRVEGLDAAGNLVAYGQTPPLALSPVDQGPIAVWVGRPGSVAAARAQLPSERTEIAAVGAFGLGAIFAGGRDVNGAPLASAAVYDVYTQSIIEVKNMSTPRAGAAAVSSSPRVIVFGGAQAQGFGMPGGALGSGELFDPSSGGLWAAVPADTTPQARSLATTIVLGSGSGLVSGGLGDDGSPVATAVLVGTGGTARLTPVTTPMVAARHQHAAAATRFPDGDGALLIGGLTDDDPGPVVERLIGQSFSAFDAPGVENRRLATATSVGGGVLLVGGTLPGTPRRATRSVVYVPTETPAETQRYDTLLPVARAHHTATKVGDDLLVCGGIDDNDQPLASCELVGTNPIVHKRTIPAGVARYGHVAVALETGPVLLAGGRTTGGGVLASIEIFTP